MKAEITPENKAKFFALYYPQKRLHHKDYEDYCPVGFSAILSIDYYANNDYYLSLKPLSSISDEDYTKIMFKKYPYQPFSVLKKDNIIAEHLNQEQVDYLRSKGYALTWMGLSVEEMVEVGWIKLI